MKMVRLRNGTEESEAAVRVIGGVLRNLWADMPGILHAVELVSVARDPAHQPYGKSADYLVKVGLLQAGGGMHDSVRNIVLSSVEGDDLDMRLVNPAPP